MIAGLRPRKVRPDAHWAWLAAGWADLRAAPQASFTMGLAVTLVSIVVTGSLIAAGQAAWLPAACGGFALIGPFLALGAYEISRKVSLGQRVPWYTGLAPSLVAPGQALLIGFALFTILMIWARIAALLLTIASSGHNPLEPFDFVNFALKTPQGLTMLVFGSAIGAAIALIAYMISVVSLPLTTRRNIDALSAIALSWLSVTRNPVAMLAFGFNIALLVALSLITGFIGLIVVFPWLGHAAWHACNAVLEEVETTVSA